MASRRAPNASTYFSCPCPPPLFHRIGALAIGDMKLCRICFVLAVGFTPSAAFAPSGQAGGRARTGLDSSPEARRPEWSPSSWREVQAAGAGTGAGEKGSTAEIEAAAQKIRKYAPLIFGGEVLTFREKLARACQGQGFLLMGDDAAPQFEAYDVDMVRDTFKAILQQSMILTYGCQLPIIKVGRMVYQIEDDGDGGNQFVEAYHQKAQTINILRAFSSGGFADLNRLHGWNLDFVERTEEDSRYRAFAEKVDDSLLFMRSIGVDTHAPTFSQVDFYTAHEIKMLPLEESLTRNDSTTGKWFDCSAHMLFVKDPDEGVQEFVRGVNNPLGLKVTDATTPEKLIELIEALNPLNDPGRLSLVVRMGADTMRKSLPNLIRAAQREGKHVLWIADPTFNQRTTPEGSPTRDFDAIRSELRAFFDVHQEMGSHPGGVRLEMTGKDVTECVGGECEVTEDRVDTPPGCDPRLNGNQAIELAFLMAERMRSR